MHVIVYIIYTIIECEFPPVAQINTVLFASSQVTHCICVFKKTKANKSSLHCKKIIY